MGKSEVIWAEHRLPADTAPGSAQSVVGHVEPARPRWCPRLAGQARMSAISDPVDLYRSQYVRTA
jgi:hypothetical protein